MNVGTRAGGFDYARLCVLVEQQSQKPPCSGGDFERLFRRDLPNDFVVLVDDLRNNTARLLVHTKPQCRAFGNPNRIGLRGLSERGLQLFGRFGRRFFRHGFVSAAGRSPSRRRCGKGAKPLRRHHWNSHRSSPKGPAGVRVRGSALGPFQVVAERDRFPTHATPVNVPTASARFAERCWPAPGPTFPQSPESGCG